MYIDGKWIDGDNAKKYIDDFIAKMYDCDDGWEFESDDSYGVRFISIQNNLCHITFSDWSEVKEYIGNHLSP